MGDLIVLAIAVVSHRAQGRDLLLAEVPEYFQLNTAGQYGEVGRLLKDDAQAQSRVDRAPADKGYFTFLLGQRFDQARRLSPRVLQDAIESKEMNPSTEIHLLIEVFEQLSTPRRI